MNKTKETDYESLTVAELRDLAEERGVEIPSNVLKADIIDTLKLADLAEAPEGRAVNSRQMTSTVQVMIDDTVHWKIKLTS